MSKLNSLIAQLCPDGVEYTALKNVSDILIGEFIHKRFQNDSAPYPVYNGGTTNTGFYDRYNREKNQIIISARGANAGYVNRVFTNFWSGNSCYTVSVKCKEVDWNFLYYWLKSKESLLLGEQQKGGIPAISKKQVENFLVPLPPLPVQSEVVRILDAFTELEAELEAELAGRKEQYEYYRDRLLDEKNLEAMDGKPVETRKLGDFSSYIRGITYNKSQETRHDGWKVLRANNIDLATGNLVLDDIKTVSSTVKVPETKILKSNDILICAGSGSKEHVGKVSFINHDLSFTFGGFMGVIRTNSSDISSRFLYYILKSNIFRRYLSSELNGTTINNLNSGIVNNFELPVPSLATQERVVGILDRFDALTTSLTDGIPAEIAMRREQYEYYRARLLDFPRLPDDAASDGNRE